MNFSNRIVHIPYIHIVTTHNIPIYHKLSQVVEISPGYYYFGGYDMNGKEIKVLMVEPGKHPRVTTLGTELDDLQKAVSIGADYQGLIEIINIGNGDCLLCNEEGKLINLEGNRRLGSDIIVGVFYITGADDEGNLVSLSEEKIKHYTERFWAPEKFDRAEIETCLFCRFI